MVIVEALKYAGADVWRLNQKGVPDLLVIFRGDIFLIEVKTQNGKLTKDQIEFHAQALNQGIKVHVVHTVIEALRAIGVVSE